ncbi:MAG: hypothetical protein ACREL7_12020 [Longimicrobiales bacterium]
MSLLSFHRFLIASAIAFCIGFAGWEFRAWAGSRSTGTLVLAITFVLFAAALALYLRRLSRFLGYEREQRPPSPP